MPLHSDFVTSLPKLAFQIAHSSGGVVIARTSTNAFSESGKLPPSNKTPFKSQSSSPSLKNGEASGADLHRTIPFSSNPRPTKRDNGTFHATISAAGPTRGISTIEISVAKNFIVCQITQSTSANKLKLKRPPDRNHGQRPPRVLSFR